MAASARRALQDQHALRFDLTETMTLRSADGVILVASIGVA